MKNPFEIKDFAERQFVKYLQSLILNESFFPLDIPVGEQKTTRSFQEINNDITQLQLHEKKSKGFGYELIISQRNYNKYGLQVYIDKICFSNEVDYLRFIKKEKDVLAFNQNYPKLIATFPTLKDWILRKPEKVIENATKWNELLNVCDYFYNNPKPNLYIRQLPIPNLHTKFIENNDSIITSLLNHLLPAEAINKDTKDFEKRFGLLESEPSIRFRILDESLCISGLSDISLPINQFETLFNQQNIENIFIAENQMCILTFPKIPKSIIIFGSGQAVINLSKISWIYGKKVFYWGDLDVEGLGILSNLRSFKADPVVLMMDWECYSKFSEICLCEGKNSVKNIPPNLTEEEVSLFEHLKSLPKERCRFEQERIPVWYVEYCIYSILQKLGIPQTISPP